MPPSQLAPVQSGAPHWWLVTSQSWPSGQGAFAVQPVTQAPEVRSSQYVPALQAGHGTGAGWQLFSDALQTFPSAHGKLGTLHPVTHSSSEQYEPAAQSDVLQPETHRPPSVPPSAGTEHALPAGQPSSALHPGLHRPSPGSQTSSVGQLLTDTQSCAGGWHVLVVVLQVQPAPQAMLVEHPSTQISRWGSQNHPCGQPVVTQLGWSSTQLFSSHSQPKPHCALVVQPG